MKRVATIAAVSLACVLLSAGHSSGVEFQIPRAMGPVISRNDLLVQYEYYVDKGGAIQTYVALFDGRNTIRLTPASAQTVAERTAAAISGGEKETPFSYDQGKGLYQVADGQRSLTITPDNGTPLTLVNADIDAFVRSCADAVSLSTTWVRDALKIEPEVAVRESTPEPAPSPAAEGGGAAEEGRLAAAVKRWIPASVMPYLNRAEETVTGTVADLYERDRLMTVVSGVLAALCVLLFFLNRRNKKNTYRMHLYGQDQIRGMELRREKEMADASSKVGDMSRQLQRIQKNNEEALAKLKDENAENAVIFADMVADMVKSREKAPESVYDVADALAERYGGSEAGEILRKAREKSKALVRNDKAAVCSDENERYRKAACSFITGAFDAKADRAAELVEEGKYAEGMGLLDGSFKEITSYGRALFSSEITKEYFEARQDELKALHVARNGTV